MVGEHLADAGEADFLFKIGWVNHGLSVLECKSTQKSPNACIRAFFVVTVNAYSLQTQLIHVAVVLQRAVDDGEEELVVVFNVLQLQVLHDDGLGAVVVGGNL